MNYNSVPVDQNLGGEVACGAKIAPQKGSSHHYPLGSGERETPVCLLSFLSGPQIAAIDQLH